MARKGFLTRLRRRSGVPLTGMQKLALVLVLVGVLAALAVVGLLAFRQSQIKFFMDVPATIADIEEHCDVSGKTKLGTYETITSMSCSETDGFVNSNAGREFRVTRAATVTLAYEASGLAQKVKLPSSAFEPEKLVRGGTVMIYVNPNRLNEVKTDITWADLMRSLLFMTGSIVVALLGMILYRLAAPVLRNGGRQRPYREDPAFDDEGYDDGDEGEDRDDADDWDHDHRRGKPNAFHEDEDLFEPPPRR